MSGQRKKTHEDTYVSPQEVAAAIGVPHRFRTSVQSWSWEALENAAVSLYWERRPVPQAALDVAS